jgi:hypothetical protein
MYSTGGPDIGLIFLGIVFGVVNLWASIVIIVAGHRYIDRTRPQRTPPGPRRPSSSN